MKRIKNILFLLILALFIVQPTQGQRLLKKLSDRAIKKAEQRIEKKADEITDTELDKAEEKLDEKLDNEKDTNESSELDLQNIMNKMGISGEPVPVENNYQFSHLIQMHFESFNKNGEKTNDGEFITHFNPKSKNMAYQALSGEASKQGKALFIIDSENGSTIILSEENGKKTGIVYGMGAFFATLGESAEENEVELSDSPDAYLANPNVKKTGRTKTIAGLKSEEYIYNDENSQSNIWITKDMKLNTKDFFSTLFKTSIYSHGMGWGYMMEATSINNDSGEKSVMQVVKVDANSNVTFSLSDYEITNLGSFQPPGEE